MMRPLSSYHHSSSNFTCSPSIFRESRVRMPPAAQTRGQRRAHTQTIFPGHHLEQYYRVNVSEELRSSLSKIDRMKETIASRRAQTNGNLVKAIQDKLRCAWTFHSNAIEGSKLSLGDTIFFLQEGLTVDGKPFKDFVDAKNHAEAIDYLYEVVIDKRPVDTSFLKSLNHLLLKGIETIPSVDALGNRVQKKVKPGHYKTEPNYVLQPDGTIHNYVEPTEVLHQMEELCSWIKAKENVLHPIIVASIAHYNKVRIHPFQDGNGRGARLLMNFILLRQHYYPAVIEVDKRKDYLQCLKAADHGDLFPFIRFTADAVHTTQLTVLEEVEKYLASRNSSSLKPR
jgi:Fic family protein